MINVSRVNIKKIGLRDMADLPVVRLIVNFYEYWVKFYLGQLKFCVRSVGKRSGAINIEMYDNLCSSRQHFVLFRNEQTYSSMLCTKS